MQEAKKLKHKADALVGYHGGGVSLSAMELGVTKMYILNVI